VRDTAWLENESARAGAQFSIANLHPDLALQDVRDLVLVGFPKARSDFEANVANTVKAFFRKANPARKRTPSATASVRKRGGWFGEAGQAPDLPMDAEYDFTCETVDSRLAEPMRQDCTDLTRNP
jgi:hypothetical protein